ncbi:MAG: hypothetical protein ACTHNU_06840 [Gaiellales bacterium]
MAEDARSRRVAVVPDRVINPPPGSPDVLGELAAAGWGVVGLPPQGLPAAPRAGWLEAVVDQLLAFVDGGYEVAALAVDDEDLRELAAIAARAGRELALRRLA